MLEKKIDLEDNYTESIGETLTNDDVYLYIKRELKYLKKYNEIPNGTVEQEPLPRLQTNLTTDKRASLFKLLVDAKLIPKTTDPDCFNWALKVIDEEQAKQPVQWKSIKWNIAKNGLRILLTPILETITEEHIKAIEHLLYDKKDNPFKLGKDEYRFVPEYRDKIEPILKSLKFERTKWYTGEKKPTSPTSK